MQPNKNTQPNHTAQEGSGGTYSLSKLYGGKNVRPNKPQAEDGLATSKPAGAKFMCKNIIDMWAVQIFFLTFVLSLSFSVISEVLLSKSNAGFAFVLLSVLIVFNIISDILGVAVTSCDIKPFEKLKKQGAKGAGVALWLLKNASKVNNICADVIGDICGIVSGALCATIVINTFIFVGVSADTAIISMLFSGITAALTVGGKAVGKRIAIHKSHKIVYAAAKLIAFFREKKCRIK